MRVLVLVKATKESEAGLVPDEKTQQMFAEMGRFNEKLIEAGVMQAGEGLKPSSEGARVRFDGAKRTVIDGPFPETKELVAGYWLWKVKHRAEAIDGLKRAPTFAGGTE
ncbi:MAG TPA: YciI family protein, partial [Thermoanaerobaculia bacterium]